MMQRMQFLRLPYAARRAARHLGTRPRDPAGTRAIVAQVEQRRQHAAGKRIAAAEVELERFGVAEFAFCVEERYAESIPQQRARRMTPEAHEVVEGDGLGFVLGRQRLRKERDGLLRAPERERAREFRALRLVGE
jgi:hypothetical protein